MKRQFQVLCSNMKKDPNRLTEVTVEEMSGLQAKADDLAELQKILDAFPMGLRVEALPDEALERLRKLAKSPVAVLCGDSLLLWNNICRARIGLGKTN